jgi:hypothetical protein
MQERLIHIQDNQLEQNQTPLDTTNEHATTSSVAAPHPLTTERQQQIYLDLSTKLTDLTYAQSLTSDDLYQSESMKALPRPLRMKILQQITGMLNNGELDPEHYFPGYKKLNY